MRSSRRLLIKDLKPEHLTGSYTSEDEEELLCSDCGVVLKHGLASQIIGGRLFCKECSPWYKAREEEDKKLIEEDLKRGRVMSMGELRFSDNDYWD